jgi:hypothetical protein
MSLHDVWQLSFDFFSKKPVLVQPVEEDISTDGGLLVVRQWDQQLQLTEQFARQLEDSRSNPQHSVLEMVRSRVFGIIAGYEDQNDHDALRSDAIFKLIADRLPSDKDLASQPTLSRFENDITPKSLLRLEDWFIERFVDSFAEPPREVTLDIDVFDDPTHGQQQFSFYHGYYGQHQLLVRPITCAENDLVVLPVLLYGTADVALGLGDDLRRIVSALRAKFPDVLIRIRADSGYSKPWLHELCEELAIEYTIGIGMNPVLQRNSEEMLQKAVQQHEETGVPQRLFTALEYQAASWEQPRWTIIKCEANAQGTNRRAVVSNRAGARVVPQGAYEEYAERGESENRNKELKCELSADRLSDHRYMANCFRMFLHCLAHNMLVSLRQQIASPPEEPIASHPIDPDAVVPEARGGRERRQQHNRRRQADPLGEGHACTWRMLLIKVAARIEVRARHVKVLLSGSWPYLNHIRDVGQALLTGT